MLTVPQRILKQVGKVYLDRLRTHAPLAFRGCGIAGLEGDGHHTRAMQKDLDVFCTTWLEETHLCLGLLNIALSINVGCDIHKGMVTVRVRCRKKESLCGLLSSLEQRLLVMTPAQNAFTGWDTERLACWAKGLNQWTLTSCIHF